MKPLIHGYIQIFPTVIKNNRELHSDEEQPRQEPEQAKNAN